MPRLSILIPCYFNEGNIPITFAALLQNEALFPSDVTFEYVFVDDGSGDATHAALIAAQAQAPDKVTVVKLSRNFGANNASLAAMHHATGDACVILAADLQDPPTLIPHMYAYWQQGIKLVIANRSSRQDPPFTRFISNTYHRMVKKYALPTSPTGGFDLYLFDKQLRQDILQLNEKNASLPHLFIWLGYAYVCLPYERRKRDIGRSRWTLSKKIKFAIDIFIGFSFLPIRLIATTGLILGLITLCYALSIVIKKMMGQISVDGWSSMMVTILFVASFQMIGLGILGEYVWRTLDASRQRPNFIVDEVIYRQNNPI